MNNNWNFIFNIPSLNSILNYLDKEYRSNTPILPSKNKVLEAFKQCPYEKVKVVIIGQDPYPQPGYATGLLFANPKDTKELSPSLLLIKDRIYKDFYLTTPNQFKFDCTLQNWANQGILLLNSALTVVTNKPGSHSNLWYPFIKDLVIELNKRLHGIIYILIGSNAHLFKKFININNNYLFCYKHPAYYLRIKQEYKCDGFLQINKILKSINNEIIQF